MEVSSGRTNISTRCLDTLVLNAQELNENSVIMTELYVTSSMMASEWLD